MCTAILHNVGVRWLDRDDDLPPDNDPIYHDNQIYNHHDDPNLSQAAQRLRDRREGETVRENLRRSGATRRV